MLAVLSPPQIIQPILDRRLDKKAAPPIALALSGGGDSMALLHIAADWAGASGRDLIALHVDHRINPASGQWAQAAGDAAHRAGVKFQRLAWTGAKPATGLSAAARAARHALLAWAAREAGARVLLMGHTADDVLEAAAMRRAGSNVGAPREWAPSPVWPEGRGLFLLRPMLGVRRAALRHHLRHLGETWIEDPANRDPRFARSRARAGLGDQELDQVEDDRAPAPLIWRELAGGLIADRADARQAAAREIAAACLCAAGTGRPPRSAALANISARLQSREVFTTSLAGARIEAGEEEVRILRESGELRRGGLAPLSLEAGETGVWDGRFEIATGEPVTIRPLSGLASRLPPAQRAAMSRLPASMRPSLPAAIDAAGRVTCPILAPDGPVSLRALALERFTAFCGYIAAES